MKWFKKFNPLWWLIHYIQHKLSWNVGRVVGWRSDGYVYVGFKCDGCGHIEKDSIIRLRQSDDEEAINYKEEK